MCRNQLRHDPARCPSLPTGGGTPYRAPSGRPRRSCRAIRARSTNTRGWHLAAPPGAPGPGRDERDCPRTPPTCGRTASPFAASSVSSAAILNRFGQPPHLGDNALDLVIGIIEVRRDANPRVWPVIHHDVAL